MIQLPSLQETIRRRRFIFVTKALLKRSICHENGFTHDRLCPCAHRKTIIIIGLLTKFHGIERRRKKSRRHLLSALIRKISEKKYQLKLEIFGELTFAHVRSRAKKSCFLTSYKVSFKLKKLCRCTNEVHKRNTQKTDSSLALTR